MLFSSRAIIGIDPLAGMGKLKKKTAYRHRELYMSTENKTDKIKDEND